MISEECPKQLAMGFKIFRYLFVLLLCTAGTTLLAQSVDAIPTKFTQSILIKGKILDQNNGEPVLFVNLNLIHDSTVIASCVSDFDGNYFIRMVDDTKVGSDTLILKANAPGYVSVKQRIDPPYVLENIRNIMLQPSDNPPMIIIDMFPEPIYKKNISETIISRDDFIRMPR